MFSIEEDSFFQEGNVVGSCEDCGDELVDNVDYYNINGEKICQSCIYNKIDEKFLVRT